jgi:sec-independent protein translocase protein TatA
MFGSLGFTELVLILFIVLIIFGAGKLPQLGEGLGKAIKGFKKSVHEADAIEAEAQAQAVAQQQPSPPQPASAPTAQGAAQGAVVSQPATGAQPVPPA